MSEPSSEPEKYTIDEMMDRLKNRDNADSEGELVTRSDGSQARKIKKRKRRSNQAVNKETKRNQKIQVLQIAGFVVLLAIAGLAVGIGVLYANSTAFRESLVNRIEDSTGAKVGMKQFRMNPATANAAEITFEWPVGNALESLQIRSVKAGIAPVSFLGKSFSGEEIVAASGELVLRAPTAGDAVSTSSDAGVIPGIHFHRYAVSHLDLYFGERNQGNLLEKTEASLFSSGLQGQAEIRLNAGLLKFKDWPPMKLDRSYIRARNSELQFESLRFNIPPSPNQRLVDRGFIDFSGIIKPLETKAKHVLSAKMESFRLSYLVGADLGRFFLGSVETKESPNSNFLAFTPGSDETALLDLTITSSLDSRIDMSNFKFLKSLANALEDRWYDLPNFDTDVSVLLKRRGAVVELSEIRFAQRGRMALRGSLANGPSGEISGILRVGLPEAIIASKKNKALDRMFGEVREDYRWLDLSIGGTSASPSDNFSELYEAAVKNQSAPSEAGNKPEIDTFDKIIDGQ